MKTLNVIRKIAARNSRTSLRRGASHAANVNLNASDASARPRLTPLAIGTTPRQPSAANDYNTAGFFMRTRGWCDELLFQGASLTLSTKTPRAATTAACLEKFSGGAGSVRWLTINNLTNRDQAMIRSGGTAGAIIHIQGNHYTMLGNSSIQADQCIWVIDSPLIGGDSVIVTNFANNANDHVSLTGTNSGFTGSWYLTGVGTSAWSRQLDTR